MGNRTRDLPENETYLPETSIRAEKDGFTLWRRANENMRRLGFLIYAIESHVALFMLHKSDSVMVTAT